MKGLVLKETSVEVDGDGVCTVWLDRPKRRNAYTFAMADELEKIFVEANKDNSVHVVVLAGKGSRCVKKFEQFPKMLLKREKIDSAWALILGPQACRRASPGIWEA